MKKKLRTTKIEELKLKDLLDPSIVSYFTDYYELEQNLGVGSFGFVVQAIDLETGKRIALKVRTSY